MNQKSLFYVGRGRQSSGTMKCVIQFLLSPARALPTLPFRLYSVQQSKNSQIQFVELNLLFETSKVASKRTHTHTDCMNLGRAIYKYSLYCVSSCLMSMHDPYFNFIYFSSNDGCNHQYIEKSIKYTTVLCWESLLVFFILHYQFVRITTSALAL